jgi:hypothetical protein
MNERRIDADARTSEQSGGLTPLAAGRPASATVVESIRV